MNAPKPGWNCIKQSRLISKLPDFWSQDRWDMRRSQIESLKLKPSQRYLRFRCKSATINGELKYACWKKFSRGEWRSVQPFTQTHRLIKWLNTVDRLPPSLLSRDLDAWCLAYTKYLTKLGMYKKGSTLRMDREQRVRITLRDSGYIGALRGIYRTLQNAYDERPEHEKDVWNLARMSVPTDPTQANGILSFRRIKQPWLSKALKRYMRYCLPIYAESTCRKRLVSLTCFSNFLEHRGPRSNARSITRNLILEYLSYLPTRLSPAVCKGHMLDLRNFLETAARERWLSIPTERLIHDEEVPRSPKFQPRYIPAAVMDQLNAHLGDLREPWRQMILILQECGMRISELLQMPLDCLTQDARGTFYLRFMRGKTKQEHTIPISHEVAVIVQEQQQRVRASGHSAAILFPNSKGRVIKQYSFAHRINCLAYKHQIQAANGKLFRFQSHQFRHTVGTRMVNLGIPHHIIQRYLGHSGPEMTSRYAHIHDATMKERLSEYLKGTLVDITGTNVPEDGPLESGDLQWFTRNVLAQALTNGYCAIPVIAGPCPHPNACLNCAHFRTDIGFLDIHKAELKETERVIAKAKANGWTRQTEMNEQKHHNLVNIITSLEKVHA